MNKKNPENKSPTLDISKNKKTKNSKNDTKELNATFDKPKSPQKKNSVPIINTQIIAENEAPKVNGSKNQKKSKSTNIEKNETGTKIRAKTATISKQQDSKKTKVTKQQTPTIAKVCKFGFIHYMSHFIKTYLHHFITQQ